MKKTKRLKQKTRTRRINKSRKNSSNRGGGDTANLIILLEKFKKKIITGQIDNVDQEFTDIIAKINSLFGPTVSNGESEDSIVKHYNTPTLKSDNYDCTKEYIKKIAAYNVISDRNVKLNNKMEGIWNTFGYDSRVKKDTQKQIFLKMANYSKKTNDLVNKLFELIKARSNYKCEKQHAQLTPLSERLKRVPLRNILNQEDNALFEYWAFFARLLTVINNENKINPSREELEQRRADSENIRLKMEALEQKEALEKEAANEGILPPVIPPETTETPEIADFGTEVERAGIA
jgi:hypothetical protein